MSHNDRCEDYNKAVERTYEVSKEKAEGLGISFIPFELSLRDSIESFKEKGFLSFSNSL